MYIYVAVSTLKITRFFLPNIDHMYVTCVILTLLKSARVTTLFIVCVEID